MPYMCMACGEIYRNELPYCPKRSCTCGEVVEIDELMVPIIRLLNEKGFATRYCCSGHSYEQGSSPYIAFDSFLLDYYGLEELRDAFITAPWHFETSNRYAFILRASLEGANSELERYEKICEANIKLFRFVDKDLIYLEY